MKGKELFNTCPDSEFFGRVSEIDYIFNRASGDKPSPSIMLFGRRWTGKTEVLRRAHMRLFWEQARVVPVYYQFKGYSSLEGFAEDYLKEILKQFLAFRMRAPGFVKNGVPLDRLEKLLVDNDLYEIADLAALHREARKSGDVMAALRNALTAPEAITKRTGIPVYLMLDDIDTAECDGPYGEEVLSRELMDSLSSSPFSFAAAASCRNALKGVLGSVESLELKGLDEDVSSSLMMDLMRQHGLEFDMEILKLAANRLEGNPMYLKSVVWAAGKSGVGLTTLKDFSDLYTRELFEGNMGVALKGALRLRGINDLRVLHAASSSERPLSDEEVMDRFRLGADEMRGIEAGLSAAGLIEINLGSIVWAGDWPMKDFINYAYETRIKGRSPDEVRTQVAREVLKEGFGFRSSKLSLRLNEEAAEILNSFNGQKVLRVLFRNQAFAAKFKNGSYKLADDRKEEEEVALPQVVGCFDTARLEANEGGPPILIAQGFQNNRYDSGNEVIWITMVKDSSAPVNLGDAEGFLRRTLILKENFRTPRIIRWVVSREGFTSEAQRRMEAEGVYSSDLVQLRILRDNLQDKDSASRLKGSDKITPVKEFEVVLPSSTKAELVAARAVEEIGTEMGFDETAIGQIKAALVEACINAFEHSKLKSSKVFLRFIASSDRLTIHVQNGGADLESAGTVPAKETEAGLPRKRGWGFELMKGLMDEVRVEKVRGGAKIVLVKYLVKKGDNRNGQEV